LGNNEEAHKYFNEQLQICQHFLPNHPQYGKCYSNIANLYEIEKNNQLALEYYQKVLTIYNRSLSAYHPDTTRVENSIENLMPSEFFCCNI